MFGFRHRVVMVCELLIVLLLAGTVAFGRAGYTEAAGTALRPRAYLPIVPNTQKPPIYLGIYIPPMLYNGYPSYKQEIDEFQAAVGRKHAIFHYFEDWSKTFAWNRPLLDIVVNNGSTPMLTWMSIPGTGSNALGCGDADWNLDSILNGSHDAYIRQFAHDAAGWPHTLLIRWGHEMNLVSYSWAGPCNGSDANATAKFVAAYHHIHDLFVEQGARNVKWVWSPNYASWPVAAWNAIENYYPGDAYVDWIGVVGYNWGKSNPNSNFRWMSFHDIFGTFLAAAAANHPSKPIMIADYASLEDDGGDKAQWITDAFRAMLTYPNLSAVVWYNGLPSDAYFKVASSPDSLSAYRHAISADPRFSSQGPYR